MEPNTRGKSGVIARARKDLPEHILGGIKTLIAIGEIFFEVKPELTGVLRRIFGKEPGTVHKGQAILMTGWNYNGQETG